MLKKEAKNRRHVWNVHEIMSCCFFPAISSLSVVHVFRLGTESIATMANGKLILSMGFYFIIMLFYVSFLDLLCAAAHSHFDWNAQNAI